MQQRTCIMQDFEVFMAESLKIAVVWVAVLRSDHNYSNDGGSKGPLKRKTSTRLHCATSQKNVPCKYLFF